MELNRERWRSARARVQQASGKGGALWKAPVGDSYVYVMPPTEEALGVPFLEVVQHREVGPDKKTVVCLGEANGKLWDLPALMARLKEKKISVGDCPVCRLLATTDPKKLPAYLRGDDEAIQKMEGRSSFLFGVIQWGEFRHGKRVDFLAEGYDLQPQPAFLAASLSDDICSIIDTDGDIWGFERAELVMINRTGTTRNDTRYKARADTTTTKQPLVVPKPVRARIRREQEERGDCNLVRLIVQFMRSASEVEAMIAGAEVTTRQVSSDKPDCFGADYEEDSAECAGCRARKECGVAAKGEPADEPPADEPPADEPPADEPPEETAPPKTAAVERSAAKTGSPDPSLESVLRRHKRRPVA